MMMSNRETWAYDKGLNSYIKTKTFILLIDIFTANITDQLSVLYNLHLSQSYNTVVKTEHETYRKHASSSYIHIH